MYHFRKNKVCQDQLVFYIKLVTNKLIVSYFSRSAQNTGILSTYCSSKMLVIGKFNK